MDNKKKSSFTNNYLAYICCIFSISTIATVVNSYFFIYFSQYLGIQTDAYMLIIIVTTILEIIVTPYIGKKIDIVLKKPKNVIRIINIFFLIYVIAIYFIFNFYSIKKNVLFFVLFFVYVLWDIIYAFLNILMGSLPTLLTVNVKEKDKLSMIRSYIQFLPLVPLQLIVPLIVYKNNLDNKSIFLGERFSLLCIFLIVFSILLMWLFNKLVSFEECGNFISGERADEIPSSFKIILKDRTLIGLYLSGFFQSCFLGAAPQFHQLTYQIFYGDGSLSRFFILPNLLPLIFGLTFGSYITKKIGKYRVCANLPIISSFLFIIFAVLPVSENQPIWYILTQTLASTFGYGLTIYSWVLLGYAIDNFEILYQVRPEGQIFSVISIMQKLGIGFGHLLVPLLIENCTNKFILSNPETWTVENAISIKRMSGLYPAIGWLVAALSIKYVYKLTDLEVRENFKLL